MFGGHQHDHVAGHAAAIGPVFGRVDVVRADQHGLDRDAVVRQAISLAHVEVQHVALVVAVQIQAALAWSTAVTAS